MVTKNVHQAGTTNKLLSAGSQLTSAAGWRLRLLAEAALREALIHCERPVKAVLSIVRRLP